MTRGLRRAVRLVPFGLALVGCAVGEGDDLELRRGVSALLDGRSDWARHHLELEVERHPRQADSWNLLATAWWTGAQSTASKAAEALRRYLELRPADTDAVERRGRLALLLGDREAALQAARELAGTPAGDLLRAEALSESRPEESMEAVATVIGARPRDAHANAVAAKVAARLGETERTLEYAQRAVELDALDSRSWYLVARSAEELGLTERAGRAWRALELARRATGDGSLARPAPAEELRLLDELGGYSSSPGYRLGERRLELLVGSGRLREAIALAARLAERDDLDAADRLRLARLAARAGDHRTARSLFSSVRTASVSNAVDALHRESARLGLASLAWQEGDADEARRLVEEPHADRGLAPEHRLLAELALAAGDRRTGERELVAAVRLAPWNASSRLALARFWWTGGRHDAVVTLLEEAPESDLSLDRFVEEHGLGS